MQESVTINRSYKDRLFKIIFEDKKELLSLYNALTGKNYQNDIVNIGLHFILKNVRPYAASCSEA